MSSGHISYYNVPPSVPQPISLTQQVTIPASRPFLSDTRQYRLAEVEYAVADKDWLKDQNMELDAYPPPNRVVVPQRKRVFITGISSRHNDENVGLRDGRYATYTVATMTPTQCRVARGGRFTISPMFVKQLVAEPTPLAIGQTCRVLQSGQDLQANNIVKIVDIQYVNVSGFVRTMSGGGRNKKEISELLVVKLESEQHDVKFIIDRKLVDNELRPL